MTRLCFIQTVQSSKENVESQLVYWDQVTATTEEVTAWLDSTVQKLDRHVLNFDDAIGAENTLEKYSVSQLFVF